MAVYIVKYGQSIYDIATEVYGDVMGVNNIIRDNELIDFEKVLETGQEIEVFPNSSTNFNQTTVDYFRSKDITNSENSYGDNLAVSGENYGEIITSNPNQQSYIDSDIWQGFGELNFNNLGETRYDGIKFSQKYSLSRKLGSVIAYLVVSEVPEFGSEILLFGDSSSSSRIYAYEKGVDLFGVKIDDADGIEIFDTAVGISVNSEFRVIVSNNSSSQLPNEKVYSILIGDNVDTVSVSNNQNIQFDFVGGAEGVGVGFSGKITELLTNGDSYDFNEGSGKYVSKT